MDSSSKLGHFNLLDEIGRGGMGTVYRAFDSSLNRTVAIKVLRDSLARDPSFLEDFLKEARNAASISHPHIVQVHFVGQADGQYYIVMELLKGRTLREIIEKEPPMKEEAALDIAIDVASGLRAAYRNHMIHGDIKPANVFIAEDVGAKILDFGLAKFANVEEAPREGIWGSPYYISPERVGQQAEDFRSDVYSLGATLFHALAGRPPFDAATPEELAAKRLSEKPPLLRELNSNVTAKTEQVVNKMLNKSIFLRYRDYDAVIADLQEAKAQATAKRLGVLIHPQPAPPEKLPEPPPARKPPWLLIGSGVALVLVLVLAFVLWKRVTRTPTAPTPTAQAPAPSPAPTKAPAPTPTPAPAPAKRTGPEFDVTFTYTDPKARSVFLIGEFNDWKPWATPMRKRGDVWSVSMYLPAGRYTYKFYVDGQPVLDPDHTDRLADGRGGFDSVVAVGNGR